MQFIIDLLSGLLDFSIGTLWAFLNELVDWVRKLITEILPDIFYALLPDGAAEFLRDIDISQIADIVEPVTWFVPFWALVTLYLHTYALAAGIRFVRWIIGFIPTIEG